MQTWRQYVVFEDAASGIRLIEKHNPRGVWARKTEPGYACFHEVIQKFEHTMREGRWRARRLVNRNGTPTPQLLGWKKKSRQVT